MKKFLFTLVALFAGANAFAISYLGAPDVELTEAQLGTTINLDLYAYFGEMVSSYEVFVGSGVDENFVEGQMPAGLEVTAMSQLGTARITYIGYVYNEDDDEYVYQETVCTPSFSTSGNYHGLAITSALDTEYALIDGEYVSCTAIKWQPGEFKMLRLKVAFAADFQGGDIVVRTMPACGQDPRGEICPRGQDNYHVCHITVEGGQVVPQDLAGTIVFGEVTEDGLLPVSYNGEEDVTITVTLTGEPVEIVDGNVQLVEGNNIVTVTVSAEGYNDLSATYEGEWTAPVVIEKTEAPVITVVDDPEAQTVTVTATGNGHIMLYWDDMLQAEGDGTAVWVIPYGDDPEGEEYGVSATAQEEGKEVSDYALETVFVPGKTVTPVTPEPTINFDEETLTLTVEGEGEIHVYVDGVEVEVPYTFEQGENEETHEVVVVAQVAGADPVTVTTTVTIPAAGGGGELTHPGYWLVMVQADGTEEYIELNLGANGDYITAYDVIYPLYYNVGNFYFMIDGVAYGAAEDATEANLGDSMMNPLTADNTNTYFVYNGYSYSIGVHLVIDQNTLEVVGYTAYVAKGGPVSVDELVNGKTVAGVRYFNLAGQEMQEANGMTIVVTTYTDGTTSSVKVMK